ncbi:MAG: NAD(+)/NADH kinase [Cyanobacteriota bacterium]
MSLSNQLSTTHTSNLNNIDDRFNNIGILYNACHKNALEYVKAITDILNFHGINTFYQKLNPAECLYFKDFDTTPDLNIIIGGDGTFLSASRCYAPKNIPLLGINSGNLGFLSQISTKYLEQSLEKLFTGDYRIEERLMLRAVDKVENPARIFTALNDIVIKRGALSRPIVLSVSVDGHRINNFLGDGLIVSTPTGSTAYNLSVGGPIIVPGMGVIVLSPISSHSLAIRPIVIPDDQTVKITIMNNPEKSYLNADGQEYTELKENDTIYVMKAPFKARLVLLGKHEDCFFDILRSKLHWGIIPGECPKFSDDEL